MQLADRFFQHVKNLLCTRSVQTILIIGIYLCVASYLSLEIHQIFYTTSMTIKETLAWLMPLTVFFFVSHTVSFFERKAPFFILSLLVFEAISNFSSVWYSYFAAHFITQSLQIGQQYELQTSLEPLWTFSYIRPVWWGADKGCLLGLAIGCLVSFYRQPTLVRFLSYGKKMMELILTRFFARLIPIFVLGFVANMYVTKLVQHVFLQYGILILWLIFILLLYIFFLFLIGSGFRLRVAFSHVRNLLPAGTIALTSGCSLSTMPWTIAGAAKNLRDPKLAHALIPATTNIQQIGDCIANSFLCFVLYKQFFGIVPGFTTWISFSIAFALARFATAAVLGGAIFIMLPIYEMYLNFTPEMIAIILAFNVMLDPLVTCTNVLANGALCRIFEWVWGCKAFQAR
jgi:hypothetical protein